MRPGDLVRLRMHVGSVTLRGDPGAPVPSTMTERDVGLVVASRPYALDVQEHLILVRGSVGWLPQWWLSDASWSREI